jgi:hypothetical protein
MANLDQTADRRQPTAKNINGLSANNKLAENCQQQSGGEDA